MEDIKEQLLKYGNNFDTFMEAIGMHYVEAQLWTDKYSTEEYLINIEVVDIAERIYDKLKRLFSVRLSLFGQDNSWQYISRKI